MRFGDTQGEEKRLAVKIALELIGRPLAGDVLLCLFPLRLYFSPPELLSFFTAVSCLVTFLPQHAALPAPIGLCSFVKRPLAFIHAFRRRVFMEYFARGESVIAVLEEVLR